MSIYSKLNDARVALQSTKLNKTGKNSFAGYNYFELGDFLPEINKIFNHYGLCGVVSFGTELATLTIYETGGDGKIEITSPMKDANLKGCHPIQNLGAVETYTRRYLWVAAMEIVEHDALDSSQPLKENKVQPPRESAKSITRSIWDEMTPEEQAFLNDIAMEIVVALNEGNTDEACRLFYEQNLTSDEEQPALWSRLDSKQRSTIKKHRESLKGETK